MYVREASGKEDGKRKRDRRRGEGDGKMEE